MAVYVATEVLGLNLVVTSLHVIDWILNKLVIMNKKLNSLLMILAFISTNAQSNELQGLFGLDLNKNITNYVSQDFVIKNQFKPPETNTDYKAVNVTGKTPLINPYYEHYFAVLDKFNAIQGIVAWKSVVSLSACLSLRNKIKIRFREKYGFDFSPSKGYTEQAKIDREITYTGNTLAASELKLSCMSGNEEVRNSIFLYTPKLLKAIGEFHDSGL